MGLALNAQVSITEGSGTTDISGTTITVQLTANNDNFAEFGIKNTSAGDVLYKVKRMMLAAQPSTWQNWVCLGLDGGSALCYSAYPNNPWTTPQPAGHPDSNGDITVGVHPGETAYLSTHVNPYANMTGSLLIRYYVIDDHGANVDSVDVNYITAPLGLKQNRSADLSVNVYPNPATNYLSVAADNVSANATVRMTDVLGKVIYEDNAGASKKIDVSEFKNGVYLVAVLEDGKAVATKRVVVKH